MGKMLVLALSLVMCPFTILAQHAHTSAPDVIDGAQQPELIPDSVAYRLYFVAVAELPNPAPEEQRRQHAHLMRIGLDQHDFTTLVTALTEFKVQYTAMIATYNQAAESALAEGIAPDTRSFLLKRDALVQAT